jgi:hypothetical protein
MLRRWVVVGCDESGKLGVEIGDARNSSKYGTLMLEISIALVSVPIGLHERSLLGK